MFRTQREFDVYWFADYSGARDVGAQRRAIRVVEALGDATPRSVAGPFTRERLTERTVDRLREATEVGLRVLAGFDHQLGLPRALAHELEIDGSTWRSALGAFVRGTYAPDAPAVTHARDFAPRFNAWCESRGRPPYFYSAIRGPVYQIPRRDPRRDEGIQRSTRFRLCERSDSPFGRGSPKPLNRVGDNGSVGGQSLLGFVELVRLLAGCESEGIPLGVWPFDGLDLASSAYENAHVFVEPYPAAVRALEVPYDDLNDALAAALVVQEADGKGQLRVLFDLSGLDEDQVELVRFEGWILGFRPRAPRNPPDGA